MTVVTTEEVVHDDDGVITETKTEKTTTEHVIMSKSVETIVVNSEEVCSVLYDFYINFIIKFIFTCKI